MTLPSGPGPWIVLPLLAGWAAVDTTAAFQIMVSQPLVVGWLTGCVVGQPVLGLFMGLSLQLLWSRLTPVGAAAFPDVGPATVAGVAVAGFLAGGGGRWEPGSTHPFPDGAIAGAALGGFLVAIAAGRAGQTMIVAVRRGNARLAAQADAAAATGSWAGLERINLLGALRSFARGVLLYVLSILGFALLAALARRLAPGSGATWPDANPGPVLFWWFGLASLVSVLWRGGRRDWLALLLGGLVGGLVEFLR